MDLVTGLRRSLVLIAVLAAALVGCSDDSENALEPLGVATADASSNVPYPVPTPTAAYRQDDPVEAYRGYLQAVDVAMGTPDQDQPLLQQFATGDALAYWEGRLAQLVSDNDVVLGRLVSQPSVEEKRSEDKLVIRDCLDDSAWQVHDKATGERLPDTRPDTRAGLSRVVMVRTAGGWQASETFAFGRGEGGCG